MVQLGQVQPKGSWRKLKKFFRFFRRPPTKGELVLYAGIVALVVAISLLYASHAEKRAEEKEAKKVAQLLRQAELEKERNKPFSPDEIVIPESEFSFYEQLANRSFHIEGQESMGGAHYLEPKLIEKPNANDRTDSTKSSGKFELISAPSGYESVDKELKNEFALELLSASEFKEPPPPSDKGPKKRLQTGSFSSTFEANIHKSQLESMGYNPIVKKAEINGKTIYRVQTDPLSPKDLAQTKRNLDEQGVKFIEVSP